MSSKALWIFFVGLIATVGIGSMVLTMLGPKAIPIIKYGNFSSPEDVGSTAYGLMAPNIASHQVWIIGVHPHNPEHLQVAVGLLRQAQEKGIDFDRVYLDHGLDAQWETTSPAAEIIDFKNDVEGFADKAFNGSEHAVVITSFFNSSHLLKGNAIHRLEDHVKKGIVGISIAEVGFGPQEQKRMPLVCVLGGADSNGTGPLGCEILQKADYLARKVKDKIPTAKPWTAALDQWGETDYILFLHQPDRLN